MQHQRFTDLKCTNTRAMEFGEMFDVVSNKVSTDMFKPWNGCAEIQL